MRCHVSDEALARIEAVLPEPGDGLLPVDVAAIVRSHQPATVYHALQRLWKAGRAGRERMALPGGGRGWLYYRIRS
jgi:hypothetical protein